MIRAQAAQLTKAQLAKLIFDDTGQQVDAEKYTKDQLLDIAEKADLFDEATTSSVAASTGSVDNRFEGATHVTVNILVDDDTRNYVMVSDENGNMSQIMKGTNVKLPIGIFHTLNDAVETHFKPRTSENPLFRSMGGYQLPLHLGQSIQARAA
jgi:hypothetical protein